MSTTLTLSGRGNILDVMQLKAPNGGVIEVTNTLTETNDLINDLPALPANGGLFHQGSRVTSLPSGSLVNIGGYWGSSKAKREPFVESLATIRDSYEIDIAELQTEGPELGAALINSEEALHVEGNGQAWCNLLVQGTSAPQQNAIDGLMKRAPWKTYDNESCFSVGGSGNDLRSAWLIKPGPAFVHLLYNPNHPTLGVERKNMGNSRIVDPDNTTTKHKWIQTIEFMIQMGLCIRDVRAVKRIANIQCGPSDSPTSTLVNTIIKASKKKNPTKTVPWMLYCDEDLYAQLVIGANDLLKVYMSEKNIYQTKLPMIGDDIIIRQLDALNCVVGSGETAIVAAS